MEHFYFPLHRNKPLFFLLDYEHIRFLILPKLCWIIVALHRLHSVSTVIPKKIKPRTAHDICRYRSRFSCSPVHWIFTAFYSKKNGKIACGRLVTFVGWMWARKAITKNHFFWNILTLNMIVTLIRKSSLANRFKQAECRNCRKSTKNPRA